MHKSRKVYRVAGEDSRLLLGAAATSASGGPASLILAPVLISALISGFDLSEKSAGLIASAEFLTIACVSFLIAPKMGVWPRRTIAVYGALIAIFGHGLSAGATDMPALVTLRVMAGIGAGMMLAAGNAVVASADNPDKLYSILVIVTGLTHLILLSVAPAFTNRWDYAGAYGLEVIFLMCLLPFVWLIPQYFQKSATAVSNSDETQRGFPLGGAIMVCLAMTLFFTRDGALWGFSQEIGRRTGMGNDAIGAVLGMTGMIGLLGAVAVAILNVRFGRLIPMTSGLVVVTVLSLAICLTDNPLVFTIGIVLWQAATFFSVPYIFGIAAALDPQGRVMAACGGCLLLGGALGPGTAGVLIGWGGYNAVAWFIVSAMATVIALALKVNRDLGLISESV